ncbi:MAG: hypothetical protein N5P05_003658 [Chroococcopsis gigantea SAG 12.99]|jgi:AcrR family transcriptional regulator|nr:TetR/AcrR family transcriptional regulator [Chlorogloea purpurea SAG 13.99]MDV3002052.1 hypothetical protein [Chroococcopsis gigantea SAG 12.99]
MKAQTRERLIKAASEVVSREGSVGATTRQIAKVAGLTEVTLFRHFQNKEQLLAAVVREAAARQIEALPKAEQWTEDIEKDLNHYAEVYSEMLEENEAMIRTFIGEARRYPEAARNLLYEASQPLRDLLIQYLRSAIERGRIEEGLDLRLLVDLFTGMLIAGMLRRTAMPSLFSYSRDTYLKASVQLFIQGIQPKTT